MPGHLHGRRRFAPVVLVLIVAVGAGAWYLSTRNASSEGALTASGTIEATEVTISPETAGRVATVTAAEGDTVDAGAVLVTLDDALLIAQRGQAEAAIGVAEANVKAAEANVKAAQADADRAQAAVGAAEAAKDSAAGARDGAQAAYQLAKAGASSSQIKMASSQVSQARTAYQSLRKAYAGLSSVEKKTLAGRTMKAQRDTAKAAIGTAQAQYSVVRAGSRTAQKNAARAAVTAARAQVTAAARQIDAAAAQAAAAQARAEGAVAGAEAAAAQLEAAEAGLAVADAQLGRLALAAPVAGTVLTRLIEPGEVVSPGAALLELADLENLALTVYVPEDRYGKVTLGEQVTVTVDSFPGQSFSGTVRRIADKAEFTPRNVQTVDGRASTVFAVELALDPSDGKLKPGMPADVVFE